MFRRTHLPEKTPFLPTLKQSYNQTEFQRKVDLYLKSTGQRLTGTKPGGYCHGLALLWVLKMSERQENWFYELKDKICEFSIDKLKAMSGEESKNKLFISDFEKFINHIDWAHRPQNYITGITQTDVDKILDLPERNYELKPINQEQQLFNHLQKVMAISTFAVVSGQSFATSGHSIACYFRDGKYHVFNGHYDNGRAKQFATLEGVAAEIHSQMVTAFRNHSTTLKSYEFFYSTHLKTHEPIPLTEPKPQVTTKILPEIKKTIVEVEEKKPQQTTIQRVAQNPHAKFALPRDPFQQSPSYGVYKRSFGHGY